MKATKGIDAPKKDGDAGYDLHAYQGAYIPPQGYRTFDTAAVEIPPGYCGLVIGRSSMNMKGIFCIIGLVDSGFRGYIRVKLFNSNTAVTATIAPGDRIAQLVLAPFGNFPIEYVERLDDTTERGITGFGSTGT